MKNLKKQRKLTSTKRDLNYIDQLLDEAVSEDQHLKSFLDPALGENNPLIASIMRDARDELLKMLEIVLLDKYHDKEDGDLDERNALKQRLASLTTPRGMTRQDIRHQQLKLIDSYLLNETGKDTLKSAINVVKPMYLTYIDTKLTEAGQELAEQLKLRETQHKVLVYNHLLREHPGLERSETLQKM